MCGQLGTLASCKYTALVACIAQRPLSHFFVVLLPASFALDKLPVCPRPTTSRSIQRDVLHGYHKLDLV
jgi:hypothetical protein